MSKFERENGVAARLYVDDETILTFAERVERMPSLSMNQLDCLQQLVTPVWDGNLMSKSIRSELCALGLVSRWNGINFCTQDGYAVLDTLGFLSDRDKFGGGKPWKGCNQ